MKIKAAVKPAPLGRPRINTKTRGRYLPAKSAIFKRDLQLIAKAHMVNQEMLKGQLTASIWLYQKCSTATLTKHSYGDIDNHVKAVFDALNGIVYVDDAQVVELHAFKCIGEPRIEIEIEEIKK